eukprot:TRINITY_DN2644_c0_g2_i1.p1 TRINITY_DN2644_c0_g2~~TRINITY_DN2644_c0_g2_i1.p1  ORF type:complete len:689 (+),score=111.06 TRINITY_DN2644_c0_g2_i1:122-2188(+)
MAFQFPQDPFSSTSGSMFAGERSPSRRGATQVPSSTALRKYSRLFHQVTGGHGDTMARISAETARDVFGRSGVAPETLAAIYQLADLDMDTMLTFREFAVAMHLIELSRKGQAARPPNVAGPLQQQFPQLEAVAHSIDSADFYLAQPSRSPRSRSASPCPSSPSMSSASRSRSPKPPKVGEDRRLPTPRDLRKYARLFCETTARSSFRDAHGNELITEEEARVIFGKSGLSDMLLQQIWDLSDVDRDRALNWQEFVLAMHLIRRTRSQQHLPDPGHGLPPDLMSALMSLESAKTIAEQPSRSPRSRSGSPAGSGAASWMTSPGPSESHAHVGPPSSSWDEFGSKAEDSGSRRRSKHKHHHSTDEGAANTFFDDALGDSSASRPRSSHSLSLPSHAFPTESESRRAAPEPEPMRDAQPVEHLEAIIEADKNLAKKLKADVDKLDAELARLEDACLREEREAQQERSECDRLSEEGAILRQQLQASRRRQLMGLKDEYQTLHLENIALQRDRGHYGKEAVFLKRVLEESTKDLQALQSSVQYLEESQANLTKHTRSLEDARKDVVQQLQNETQLLETERQEVERVRKALDALRASGLDGLVPSIASGASPQGFSGVFGGAPDLLGPPTSVQQPRNQQLSSAPDSRNGGGTPWWSSGFSAARPEPTHSLGAPSRPSPLPATGTNPLFREGV